MRAAGRTGRRSLAAAALLTALAPFVGYAAVRTAAYNATENRTDFGGLLPPPSPWVDVRRVMQDARLPRRPVPANARRVAERTALAAPLAFEPFLIAGRAAETAGQYGEATRLMEEARRRRPNYIPTRVHLLSYYSLANAYQQAIDEADLAMRVNQATTTYILPGFAKLVAADPKARRAIAAALARGPSWDQAFYGVAAEGGMKPDDAFALVEDIRRQGGKRGDRRAQDAFLVQALVKADRFSDARALWRRTLAGPADTGARIVDGSFSTGAPAPFGWRLESSAEGVAERAKATAGEPAHLGVSYFAGAPMTLAEQLLVLDPGTYRLAVRSRVEGLAGEASLAWQLVCANGGRALGRLPLPASDRPQVHAATVSVPSGCTAQRLQLVGTPADLPRTATAQIFEVSVQPAGEAAR